MPNVPATLICPFCSSHQTENIPDNACMPFYKCKNCGKVIRAKKGDCCVFCSYSNTVCPLKQSGHKPKLWFVGFVILGFIALLVFFSRNVNQPPLETMFLNSGLYTNTFIHSIPLELVLDGGPRKDGIPALNHPKFTTLAAALSEFPEQGFGILVQIGSTVRYYPFSILTYHEIVNDTIEGQPVLITFCPLCGSAIVFDSRVDSETLGFGVSGKLYESNLLMYDKTSESLWSQILGEAVVGDKTGKKLTVLLSQMLTFAEVAQKYPQAEVLSKETGFSRNYDISPYGDYDENDEIYFPISVQDQRFHPKELMYIVNTNEHSVAFKLNDLMQLKKAEAIAGSDILIAESEDSEIVVRNSKNERLPGYYAMWFSWSIHHQKDGIVWQSP